MIKHRWLDAKPLPWYHTLDDLIKVSWLTLPDPDNPGQNTNKFASGDTYELFQENLKKQPEHWHYRKKEIEYNVNSRGYRTKEFDDIDWKEAIVIFGCSMTAGIGVAENETISHYLEYKSGRPVVNLGIPGAGLDFTLYNNFLLHKNYPKPWAVVNLFTNTNRLMLFKKMYVEFLGLWSENELYWRGYMMEEEHNVVKSIFDIQQINYFWKDIKTFNASWFDDTAFYGECMKLHFQNGARDLVHCGPADNKRNATVIWSHLRDD